MDELKILLPGTKKEFKNFDAIVYPVGFSQIRSFTDTLISSLRIVFNKISVDIEKLKSKSESEKNEEAKRIGMEMISLLSPIAARDLLGIFSECVIIKTKPTNEQPNGVVIDDGIKYIPHWFVPPLIVEWLKESFLGEEKIRPWIEAAKEVSQNAAKMNLNSLLV